MKDKLINDISKSFIDDGEKMYDFFTLSKEEFLESYSYLTEEEWESTRSWVQTAAELFLEYTRLLKKSRN